VKYVIALGNVCSAIARPPSSAILSAGLEKCGKVFAAPRKLTDIWRGELGGARWLSKIFAYIPPKFERGKEVSIQSVCEAYSRVKLADRVETGADMEEAIPSKHPTVSWG
jgi:hypothetical protein